MVLGEIRSQLAKQNKYVSFPFQSRPDLSIEYLLRAGLEPHLVGTHQCCAGVHINSHIYMVCKSSASVNHKIICKVTLSLGLLSPQTLLRGGTHKVRKFIRSQNEVLKISILMHKVQD